MGTSGRILRVLITYVAAIIAYNAVLYWPMFVFSLLSGAPEWGAIVAPMWIPVVYLVQQPISALPFGIFALFAVASLFLPGKTLPVGLRALLVGGVAGVSMLASWPLTLMLGEGVFPVDSRNPLVCRAAMGGGSGCGCCGC